MICEETLRDHEPGHVTRDGGELLQMNFHNVKDTKFTSQFALFGTLRMQADLCLQGDRFSLDTLDTPEHVVVAGLNIAAQLSTLLSQSVSGPLIHTLYRLCIIAIAAKQPSRNCCSHTVPRKRRVIQMIWEPHREVNCRVASIQLLGKPYSTTIFSEWRCDGVVGHTPCETVIRIPVEWPHTTHQ